MKIDVVRRRAVRVERRLVLPALEEAERVRVVEVRGERSTRRSRRRRATSCSASRAPRRGRRAPTGRTASPSCDREHASLLSWPSLGPGGRFEHALYVYGLVRGRRHLAGVVAEERCLQIDGSAAAVGGQSARVPGSPARPRPGRRRRRCTGTNDGVVTVARGRGGRSSWRRARPR